MSIVEELVGAKKPAVAHMTVKRLKSKDDQSADRLARWTAFHQRLNEQVSISSAAPVNDLG